MESIDSKNASIDLSGINRYMSLTEDTINAARTTNLYEFLLKNHQNDIIIESNNLRLYKNHSVCVGADFWGYTDFADGTTGNAIDFLVSYLDYDFREAVFALLDFQAGNASGRPGAPDGSDGGDSADVPDTEPPQPMTDPIPMPAPASSASALNYLGEKRSIPDFVTHKLVHEGLLYVEGEHHNLVFPNAERTFAELRGTSQKPFHGVCAGSDPVGFWWFKSGSPNDAVDNAFICESAIDAISLYCLREMRYWEIPDLGSGKFPRYAPPPGTQSSLYVSIAGVAKQRTIDRIKAAVPTVIAVDNDHAGDVRRAANPDCKHLIPSDPFKDWNEMWSSDLKKKIDDGYGPFFKMRGEHFDPDNPWASMKFIYS